jgi:hypothetical protein
VIWTKTEAGRHEIQARALVKERARRNLLLLIDGTKSEAMLLSNLAGIGPDDFKALEAMALITPVGESRAVAAPSEIAMHRAVAAERIETARAGPTTQPNPSAALGTPLDYSAFTAALTQLISTHLGLRGFVLTLAVERASTIEDLQAVAQRTLDQIRDRRGEAAAVAARQALYGA